MPRRKASHFLASSIRLCCNNYLQLAALMRVSAGLGEAEPHLVRPSSRMGIVLVGKAAEIGTPHLLGEEIGHQY